MSDISVKITILEKDDDMYVFDVEINSTLNITVMSFVKIENDILFLDKVDIGGPGALSLNGIFIRKILYNFANYFKVKEVQAQGGRRTTGKNKGKIPSIVKIKIP